MLASASPPEEPAFRPPYRIPAKSDPPRQVPDFDTAVPLDETDQRVSVPLVLRAEFPATMSMTEPDSYEWSKDEGSNVRSNLLRGRASSGELGVLFDRAIRLAEQRAVDSTGTAIETGTKIERSTSSPPQSLRAPDDGAPSSDLSPSSSSLGGGTSSPSNDPRTAGSTSHNTSVSPKRQSYYQTPSHSSQESRIRSSRTSSQNTFADHPAGSPDSFYGLTSHGFQTQPYYTPAPYQFASYESPAYPSDQSATSSAPFFAPPHPLLPSSHHASPSSPPYGYNLSYPRPRRPAQQHQHSDFGSNASGADVYDSDGNPTTSPAGYPSQLQPYQHAGLPPYPSFPYQHAQSQPPYQQPTPSPQYIIQQQHRPDPSPQQTYPNLPSFSAYSDYPSHAFAAQARWNLSPGTSFPGYTGSPLPAYSPYGPHSPYGPVPFLPDPSTLSNPQYSHGAGAGTNVHAPVNYSPPLPPQPYEPPQELARGQLAKANFREALDHGGRAGEGRRGGNAGGPRSALPKPPSHSPHALWVGNVPSDATHVELWHFFTQRPVPATSPFYASKVDELLPRVDLRTPGVESIHVIARSNCAFVNYVSEMHLQHSINVSHNVSLRPFDHRCKELVCRVRKTSDDVKSGVGAQRTGGMHHAHVNRLVHEREKQAAAEAASGTEATSPPAGEPPHRNSTTSSSGTHSTSSSFLSKHFPKRFFILKSHDEDDLRLSVERGLWATQSHNEPVLDQAFRNSKDIFLFFSANKSGEWFGYGRMTSGINSVKAPDGTATDPFAATIRHPSIPEDEESSDFPTRPAMLLGESEGRVTDQSPMPMTPGQGVKTPMSLPVAPKRRGDSAPATMNPGREAYLSAGGHAVAANLHLPDGRAGLLDEKALASVRQPGTMEQHKMLIDQENAGAAMAAGENFDGVWRKDMAPTAEERNARLEEALANDEGGSLSPGWGRPFAIEWIKVGRLPFTRTRHIRNTFNSNREVKISRDGTEVEPSAGQQLIEEFWRDEGGVPAVLLSPRSP